MTSPSPIGPAALLRDARHRLGWRLVALLITVPVAAIIEGFGLTLLFPLLAQFGIGSSGAASPLAQAVNVVLAALGIPGDLSGLLVFVVIVLQIQVGATLLRGWFESDCMARYVGAWQSALFEAFVAADWTYSMGERSATQASAILTESGRIAASLNLLVQILGCIVMAIIYAGLSLASAWQVVAFLIAFGAAAYAITRPLISRGGDIGRAVSLSAEDIQHRTHEFLQNLKLVKATATEVTAAGVFNDIVDHFRAVSFRENIHPKIVLAIYTSLGFLMLCTGIWVSVRLLQLPPAAIVVSIYVFLRLYMQLSNLQGFRQSFAMMLPSLTTVNALLSRAQAAAERTHGGIRLSSTDAVVLELKDLKVCYDEHVALTGVTCHLPAGALIGVTGPSGAGKSTLVDAIVGLIRPTVGDVMVDGHSLDSLDIPSWRRSIGYVGQETLLMRGSVAQNIAWGFDGINPKAIREAAALAHADDFIQAMPEGYNTIVGDRGVRLSGGQRQRLGLARAMLGTRRLVILDEATSALDSESEACVLDAVANLRGRVSIIMVAHRLSTLRLADNILVFESGRLVENGRFTDLVADGGRFARLWQLQSEAVEPERP